MCLSSIKKHAIGGRNSVLDRTFQGQRHGCKDFGLRFQLRVPRKNEIRAILLFISV
jgi:hypothetical protein